MIEVRLDASAFKSWLRRAGDDLQAGVDKALGKAMKVALMSARETTAFKDRTGELRRSIAIKQRSRWVYLLSASAKHAVFVEHGTKPHRIEARRARVLRFVQSNELRFRRHVQHPGTKPTHFMQKARDEGEKALNQMVRWAAARAFR